MKEKILKIFEKSETVGHGSLIAGAILTFVGHIKDHEMLKNLGIKTGFVGACIDVASIIGSAYLKQMDKYAEMFGDDFDDFDEEEFDEDDLFMEDVSDNKIVEMTPAHDDLVGTKTEDLVEDPEDPEAPNPE